MHVLYNFFTEVLYVHMNINSENLCDWGNDAASEVLTEARLLLVEN